MLKPVQASTYNFRDIIENGFLYVEYHQKYQRQGKALTLIGANFDSTTQQITEWRQADGSYS